MFLLLSKLVPPFLYPLGLSVLLLAAAFLLPKRNSSRRYLCLAAFVLLAVFSSGAISRLLLHSLEDQYPERTVKALPAAQAIVVLGGGTDEDVGRERLIAAADLYRAGKAPFVLFSGGAVSLLGSQQEPAEAEAAVRQLQKFGVPAGAIRLETQSRNTRENGLFTRKALPNTTNILLVTSAFHMPRAAAVFTKVGFRVTAVPVDFWSTTPAPEPILRWIPDPDALSKSQVALKEWLGILVYRMRGWV